MATVRRVVASSIVLAMAMPALTGESHSESNFFTTDPPHRRNASPGQVEGQSGLMERLRVAMGLSPKLGEPMQLVPQEPGPAAPPAPLAPPSDIFVPATAIADDAYVGPDDGTNVLGLDEADPPMRRPPPVPLVSVVGALDPEPDATAGPDRGTSARLPQPTAPRPSTRPTPAADRVPAPRAGSTSFDPTPPRRAIAIPMPTPAPRAVGQPLPRSARPAAPREGLLLAGSTPPVPALPPRHPRRDAAVPDAGSEAKPDASVALSAMAVLMDPAAELATQAENETAAAGEPKRDHQAKMADETQHDTEVPQPLGQPATAPAPTTDEAAPAEDGANADVTAAVQEDADTSPPRDKAKHADDDEAPPGEDADSEEAASEPPPSPSELPKLMRVMSALQDDIARGSGSALKAQRVMSKRVAQEIAANSERTLAVPRNARALVHYALTGGSPSEVRNAIERTTFTPPYDELLPGALAFLEGRQNDARRHFEKVTLEALPSVTAGPVRLALAALTLEGDPAMALNHLDWARHSAPGTLVEEAALRRAVLLTAERNMLDRFEALTSRYLRRFRNSAYAGNFRQRLASALTRMRFIDEPDGFERLAAVLEPMSLDGRREIYLDIARSAVETGRSVVAATAARLSRESAPTDSLDAARADLYAAAADVVDPGRNAAAVATLDTMDVSPLPQGDRVLRTAALRLGQAVADLPEPTPPIIPAGAPALPSVVAGEAIPTFGPTLLSAVAAPPPEEDEPSAIESRVSDTLAEIDALLRNSP